MQLPDDIRSRSLADEYGIELSQDIRVVGKALSRFPKKPLGKVRFRSPFEHLGYEGVVSSLVGLIDVFLD
ncbi:hypothetical protein ColKHC_01909 [Colletotrichum higginsianum]|nr:hypothetical protein ColKHC_01909 [Colletotrichum higginsianum]